jgi:4'-phosphopantetheinyl transferase
VSDDWPALPRNLKLQSPDVHVVFASTHLSPEVENEWRSILAPAEIERIDRLRVHAKRNEAIISRGVLRVVLGRALGCSPAKIALETGPHGKPFLTNGAAQFNVSHTAGAVLLAVSIGHELGIDIEAIRDDLDCPGLANRFFTTRETAWIKSLPPQEQAPTFLRLWTRKEALLKGIGKGVAAGLNHFEIPLQALNTPVRVGDWLLHDINVECQSAKPTWLAALAAESSHDPPTIHHWQFTDRPT